MNRLAKKVIKNLLSRKRTISICESCTGGLLSFSLAKIPNASQIYSFGLITYSNKSKIDLLKISKKLLDKYGAVSKPICLYMAKKLNKIAKTTISVSITGIAGPSGGTSLKPVGLVYIGIKFKKKLICKKLLIKNKGRIYIQKETVKKTLRLLSNLN